MLRRLVRSITLGATCALLSAHAWADQDSWVYIGTRSSVAGEGILAARVDGKTGALTPAGYVSTITRPTTLTPHPYLPVLYAVSDPGNTFPSTIYSFVQNPETGALTVKNSVLSGGTGSTYLAADTALKSLFVASFGSGQVSWLPISRDGSLGDALSVVQDTGSGPNPRQAGPHAHSVQVDPTKRFLLTPDFGADKIYVRQINTATDQLDDGNPPFITLPAGSGPRHSVFHITGLYYYNLTELTAQVTAYRWDLFLGRLTPIQTLNIDDPAFTGTKSGSHIVMSRDGRFIYIASRGSNTLEVYSVNFWNGTLSLVQRVADVGVSPWDFAIDPSGRWLIVANNTSNTVDEYAVDCITGQLTATGQSFTADLPSNVVFMDASGH